MRESEREKESQELEAAPVAVGQECGPRHPDLRIIGLSLNSKSLGEDATKILFLMTLKSPGPTGSHYIFGAKRSQVCTDKNI